MDCSSIRWVVSHRLTGLMIKICLHSLLLLMITLSWVCICVVGYILRQHSVILMGFIVMSPCLGVRWEFRDWVYILLEQFMKVWHCKIYGLLSQESPNSAMLSQNLGIEVLTWYRHEFLLFIYCYVWLNHYYCLKYSYYAIKQLYAIHIELMVRVILANLQ